MPDPAGRIGGSGHEPRLDAVHAFFAITAPLLAPSIVAAALLAFAVSLDQFVVSYFLSTPGVSTLPRRNLCIDPQGLHAGNQCDLDDLCLRFRSSGGPSSRNWPIWEPR